jgi:hypothetical protein
MKSARFAFHCPHCRHEVALELTLSPSTATPLDARVVAPPAPAVRTAKKSRGCPCGHPADFHQDRVGPCLYGKGTPTGGCDCPRFHTRRMGSATQGPKVLSPRDLAILQAIVQRHPRPSSRRQIALITGYSGNSGNFNSGLAVLRRYGFIDGEASALAPTHEGIRAAGPVPRMPKGAELIEYWSQKLGPCAQAMLQHFAGAYPKPVDRDELANLTGYSAKSGNFNSALARLRTLGLVRGFAATSELMEQS